MSDRLSLSFQINVLLRCSHLLTWNANLIGIKTLKNEFLIVFIHDLGPFGSLSFMTIALSNQKCYRYCAVFQIHCGRWNNCFSVYYFYCGRNIYTISVFMLYLQMGLQLNVTENELFSYWIVLYILFQVGCF